MRKQNSYRVINEDIAGLFLMSWAALNKNRDNVKAKVINDITGMMLDCGIWELNMKDAALAISGYLELE